MLNNIYPLFFRKHRVVSRKSDGNNTQNVNDVRQYPGKSPKSAKKLETVFHMRLTIGVSYVIIILNKIPGEYTPLFSRDFCGGFYRRTRQKQSPEAN